eukprot:scaffold3823_cov195-Amphora_coffeaeformis.AAC.21
MSNPNGEPPPPPPPPPPQYYEMCPPRKRPPTTRPQIDAGLPLPLPQQQQRSRRRSRRHSLGLERGRFFSIVLILALILTPSFVRAFVTTTRKQQRRRGVSPRPFGKVAHNNGGKEEHGTDASLVVVPDNDNDNNNHRLLPQHIAIICDGNSRWAAARGLPAAAGHAAGAERVVQILSTLQNVGVRYCTLYGFSTENWSRPPAEINDLLRVMEQTARRLRTQIRASDARIRILGDLDDARIPAGLRDILTQIQNETTRGVAKESSNETCRQTVCLAINYGGRRDILKAAQRLAEEAMESSDPTFIDSLTEDDLSSYLGTDGIPDPDLLIRTSGEHRISNFLLWNIAYAEIYFTDTLWPDFDSTCILEALSWYSRRHRRFGSRSDAAATVVQKNGTPSTFS